MKKFPTSWNFKLLYKSDTDPHIEKDLKKIEKAFTDFEKKYKGKAFASSVPKLLKALRDYEKLDETLDGYKPYWYFARQKDTNSQNPFFSAKSSQYQQRITNSSNKGTFFVLELGKISAKNQRKFLSDKSLSRYSYLLKSIFDKAKYNLTEKEEQLASLLHQPAYSMWVNGQNKYQNGQTISFKGKKIPVSQVGSLVSNLTNKKERRFLHREFNKTMQHISHFAEAEINAVYNFKKIMDGRRGYEKPYSETVLSYENNEKTVESLVEVITKNFKISHRFYKLHAKLLGEKKITRAERGMTIGVIKKKFDFQNTVNLIKKAFDKFDPKFGKILDEFIKNGQLDIYPRKGKISGAYHAPGAFSFPSFVLLNHTDDIRSVETLAHEMGHSFHTHLTKEKQPALYQGYSMSVAEVASTFFEQLAMEDLESELSTKDYLILLHNNVRGSINTIFAQIAFFNYELELHNRIRKEGQIAKEEMAKIMNKHLGAFFGPAVELSTEDGYFFVYLAHIRSHFYVYSYAFGQLVSRALFEKWKEDKSYAKKIEQFLSAGGSMSPEDIFKSIGINISDPKFFETGLKAIEKDIIKLEKLSSKLKK